MPELPEVETIRRNLNTILQNEVIESVNVYYRPIVSNNLDFETKLKGQRIHRVERQAKYLKFILDDYMLISHLRMEGKYFMDAPRSKHIHVVFNLESGHTLSYEDTRKFGRFELVDIKEKDTYLKDKKNLAPDPIDMDLDTFYDALKHRKITIKEILLDQTVIGGIGNIYANEILYLSKIHPAKKGNLITKKEANTLLKNSIKVLNKAIQMGGTTIDTYESLGHKGMFQQELHVHGQTGKTCQYGHDTIVKFQLKGRGTYICPSCQPSYVVAITGGIATGKSTVSQYLKKLGYVVIDADSIVGELYEDDDIVKKIAETFELELPLDKAKLANIVFNQPAERKKLEHILHPLVFEQIQAKKETYNEHMLFLDIPLLFEAGYSTYDESVLIDASRDNQVMRLMKRNRYTKKEASLRIDAQMPLSEKRKLATVVIENNDSIETLYEKIDKLLERYV